MRVAVVIKRLAFDELHDEVRQAVVSCTAVKQARDVWMIEGGEDLSFSAKTPQNKIGVHAALHELDRDTHLEFPIDADCFIDRAHAAAPYFALDLISAQPAPEHWILIKRGVGERFQRTQCAQFGFAVQRLLEQVAGAFVLRQQRLDFISQRCIVRARLCEIARAFFRYEIDSGFENSFNLLVAFGGHGNRVGQALLSVQGKQTFLFL